MCLLKRTLRTSKKILQKTVIHTLSVSRQPFLNTSFFLRRLDFNFTFNSFIVLIICNTKKESKKLIKTNKDYIKSQYKPEILFVLVYK